MAITANTSVRFVKGYHEVTPVPQLAIDKHLEHRLGVILDICPEGVGHWDALYELEAQLFLGVLREISHVIDHDTLRIEVEGGMECESVDALGEHLLAIPEEDRVPPLRMHFRRKGKLVCLEETEFWSQCGGPLPYSDSDTLSFYTAEDMSELLVSVCSAACRRVSVAVRTEVIQASVCPVHVPSWKLFFRKVIPWVIPWA